MFTPLTHVIVSLAEGIMLEGSKRRCSIFQQCFITGKCEHLRLCIKVWCVSSRGRDTVMVGKCCDKLFPHTVV